MRLASSDEGPLRILHTSYSFKGDDICGIQRKVHGIFKFLPNPKIDAR